MTTDAKQGSWTWQEIFTEHSSKESCWVYSTRTMEVYDVTEWVALHPGGETMLLLFAGRDIEQVVVNYHPFHVEKVKKMLASYKIGTVSGPSEHPKFRPDSGFYQAVCGRIKKYFDETGLDPLEHPGGLYWLQQAALLIGIFLCFYVALLRPDIDWSYRLLAAAVSGTCASVAMMTLVHDASHHTIGHNSKLATWVGWLYTDAINGVSFEWWYIEHVVAHHQYTNIIPIDPNAPEGLGDEAMFRTAPQQQWFPKFVYQALYFPLMLGAISIDGRAAFYWQWFERRRKNIYLNNALWTWERMFWDVLGKVLYVTRMWVLPLAVVRIPFWTEFLPLWFVTEFMGATVMGMCILMAHITTKVHWPEMRTDRSGQSHVDEEWAVMQLKVTKSWAQDNKLLFLATGGLTHHVCHHLLPSVSHTHYDAIYPIIVQTANEYGVDYIQTKYWYQIMQEFFQQLYQMGRKPDVGAKSD